MKPTIEFPKYINNELTKRRPDMIFVSTRGELLAVEKYELEDGNRVFQTNVCCGNECSIHECPPRFALIITFGISCIIDRIVVLCPECAEKMTKKQKKLLDRYQITND